MALADPSAGRQMDVRSHGLFKTASEGEARNERMTEIVRRYGADRLIIDSACDWGVCDPLAVPKTAQLMAMRGILPDTVRRVTYANALAIYGLNGEMREEHWLKPASTDRRTLYEGNSILRGGQSPNIETRESALGDLAIR